MHLEEGGQVAPFPSMEALKVLEIALSHLEKKNPKFADFYTFSFRDLNLTLFEKHDIYFYHLMLGGVMHQMVQNEAILFSGAIGQVPVSEGIVPDVPRVVELARDNASSFGVPQPAVQDLCALLRMAFDPEGEYLRHVRAYGLPRKGDGDVGARIVAAE